MKCNICGKEMKRKKMTLDGYYVYRCSMCGDYSERLEINGEVL